MWAGPRSTIKKIARLAPAIRRLRNSMNTAAVTPPFSLIIPSCGFDDGGFAPLTPRTPGMMIGAHVSGVAKEDLGLFSLRQGFDLRVDGVTGLHRASRSLASALWVARSLAAGLCGRVVVPQTEDVIKRSRASPLQASLRDDHDLLCRDRRVIGILERLRGGRGRQDHAGAEDCE